MIDALVSVAGSLAFCTIGLALLRLFYRTSQ